MKFSALVLFFALSCQVAEATDVRFNTTFGEFEAELFDMAAPNTVANFLNYVRDGDYQDSIIHRSVPGFVIQGGGFFTDGSQVPADPPIATELGLSNVRGTIATATSGEDTATSQWFINLGDNSFLDTSGGGFTVFGIIQDLTIPDAVAALPVINATALNSSFTELPVLDGSLSSPALTAPSNLFRINSISIVPEPSTGVAWALLPMIVSLRRRSRNCLPYAT